MTKTAIDLEIIAHRGASGYAPENTMAAFSKAVLLGARSIEFDVQQTKDRELVVIHDPNLKRLARDKRLLAHLSYKELSKLDVGSWFDFAFAGERVPTLTQVLDFLKGVPRGIELQLEIKDGKRPYPGIEQRVLEVLRHHRNWEGRVVISSFNHMALRRVRELSPTMRLGYLAHVNRFSTIMKEAVGLRCESVHLSVRRVSASWARAIHDAGMRLLVYTINTRKDLERMRRIGVDGIFSDYPDLGADGPDTHKDRI